MQLLNANEGPHFPSAAELRARVVTLFAAQSFGTLVPYTAIVTCLECDPRTDKRGRDAVLRARTELLREHQRKIVNVRQVGYRVLNPNEQVQTSQGEQARARRWYRRALGTVTYVAMQALSPEEAAKVLTEQARCAIAVSLGRKLVRQKQLPARQLLALPSGRAMVEMFTKAKGGGT